MENIKPSPAISVSADTSIRETLRTMREHNVGSVLINNHQAPHELQGIFTERDLLKWVGEIEKNDSWDKSISTVMTRKMLTLNVLEIDQAADVMIEHGFRHCPIVYEGADGRTHVAGVVSMRDLFKGLVKSRKHEAVLNQFADKRVLMLGHGKSERELQTKLLESHVHLVLIEEDFEIKSLNLDALIPSVLSSDLFVMDLDGFPAQTWALVLKRLLDEKKRPPVFIVYDPVHQDSRSVLTLKQLSKGAVIHLYPKPINLLEYLRQMERALKVGVKSLA